MRRKASLILAGLAACLGTETAWADVVRDEAPEDAPYHVGLEALSDLPLHVGARLWVDTPVGLHLSTTLGDMPQGYVEVINLAVVGLGGYNQETAEVVAAALANSLVWRLHVGWKEKGDSAFYIGGGYSLITLGGGVSGEDLLRLATDEEPDEISKAHVYAIDSTLHLLDIELGWAWVFLNTYTLRVGAGFSATVHSNTDVYPQFTPIAIALESVKKFSTSVARYLDETYRSNVFSPTLSMAFGVRFF